MDEIDSHLKSRNAYIQGTWVSRVNGQPFAMLSQKKRKVQTKSLATEELGKLSDTLLIVSNNVFDWVNQVVGAES
ncbi:hypothetical protein ACIOEW_38205 [Streptomyces sp. NPDC087901]|uniref:hypothetical protein n=1 Tax=Streptomyces sp. NPDC087901 TaxID=3365818 RepID=UPI0037F3E393